MQLFNYSERSFVLFGEDTKTHKDLLKSLGGRWNGGLRNSITGERFGGWVFSNNRLNNVSEILENYITAKVEPSINSDIPSAPSINSDIPSAPESQQVNRLI